MENQIHVHYNEIELLGEDSNEQRQHLFCQEFIIHSNKAQEEGFFKSVSNKFFFFSPVYN